MGAPSKHKKEMCQQLLDRMANDMARKAAAKENSQHFNLIMRSCLTIHTAQGLEEVVMTNDYR